MGKHESPARPARQRRLRPAACFAAVIVLAGVAAEFLAPPGFVRWAVTGFLAALALAAVTAVRPRWLGRERR